MKYTSTRGGIRDVDFPSVVFSGYAPDGGLYVPQTIPIINQETLISWQSLNYAQLSSKILSHFVNDELKPYLPEICANAFSNFEFPSNPVPIKKVGSIYIAETYRGPTLAFKDIGLNLLSQVMELLLRLQNKPGKANVLVETSGDTGPAAVASIMLNTTRLNVFCMFPFKQVTEIQKKQLTTAMYKNDKNARVVNVYSTDRNSDDQCMIIKNIFKDKAFVNKYSLCAMNSINFVRIAAQICYYFYCYLQVVPRCDKEIHFAIPSGAFGNTCAASFAKAMGLPIKQMMPCCNENNIVFRTLMFGDFSSSFKNYHATKSPAMDVQVAYNLERFFWLCLNMNGEIVRKIMLHHERNHNKDEQNMEFDYRFDAILRKKFERFIKISYCVSDENIKSITKYFADEYQYLVCPHSACSVFGAFSFLNDASLNKDSDIPIVAIATASAAKFPKIIGGFFGDAIDKEKKQWIEKELYHEFAPKKGDKEECIQLMSDEDNVNDKWSARWTEIIKRDIIKANKSAQTSKL